MSQEQEQSHSRFAPSKMARIIKCPGSVHLCELVPQQPSSKYAEEGTMMHAFMAQCDDLGPKVFETSALTAEQRNACLDAWDYVQMVKSEVTANGTLALSRAESRVTLDACPEVYGTADYTIVSDRKLHVLDYKFGANVFVDVNNNWQMICYGLGAMASRPAGVRLDEIVLHIIQPRMANYARVSYSVEQMLEFEAQIQRAVAAAQGPEVICHPGEDQCRWCDAAARCNALQANAYKGAQAVFAAEAEIVANRLVPDEIIAEFYKIIPTLKSAIKVVEQHIMAELLRQRKVPGLKLVRTRARRAWADESKALAFIIDRLDDFGLSDEDVVTTKVVSPAQAEKLMRGIKTNEEFKALITKGKGSLAVVNESDARPEATGSAEDVFSEHAENEE